MATLIMWRTVHERMDRDGFEPDTWILMGAWRSPPWPGICSAS